MKVPYIKLLRRIGKIRVYIVDGFYIRKDIDSQFTNFGQHYRFSFIPENEFWIDFEHGKEEEANFYIDHMLVEYRLMKKGISYELASEKANITEKAERVKSKIFQQLIKTKDNDDKTYKKIKIKKLDEFSQNLEIWLVRGNRVRDLFFLDFTEGGHDKVYKFVPKNEVWLDDDLSEEERVFVLLHELYERRLMIKGKGYNSAHNDASELESYYRENPHKIMKRLAKEIKKQPVVE